MRVVTCDRNWQLFFDNHAVARSTGFSRVVCPPRSRGLVIAADRPWETQGAATGTFGRRADGSFYAFYRAMWWDPSVAEGLVGEMKLDRAHWSKNSVAYATSQDGIHWDKPNLGLIPSPAETRREGAWPTPFGTTMDNNIGVPFGRLLDLGAHGNVADPEKRFILTLQPNPNDPSDQGIVSGHPAGRAYFCREVPDFLNDPNWQEKLIPTNSPLSPRGNALHYWDSVNEEWVAIVQCVYPNWLPSRDIARYASKDLKNWTAATVLYPDAEDPHAIEQFEEPMFLTPYCAEGVVFGLLTWFFSDRLHPASGPRTDLPAGQAAQWRWYRKGLCDVRLVISRDGGKTWDRTVGRQPWIPGSADPHAFDRMTFLPTPPVRVGDEDWFYVTVADGDHLSSRNEIGGDSYYHDRVTKQQIALYTQKHNRAVCMRVTTHSPQVLISKPLMLQGDSIQLNVDASHGRVRVAIASAEQTISVDNGKTEIPAYAPHLAKPLPGFSFEECQPVHVNNIEHTVKFKNGVSVASLKGRPVFLLLEVSDADVFGFRSV